MEAFYQPYFIKICKVTAKSIDQDIEMASAHL